MPVSPNKLLNNDHGNYVYATYTGHIFDTTLDIYFAEARFYDAQTRTWLAMDLIKDGGNWYQYVYSNPIKYFDPDGKIAEIIIELIEKPIEYGLGGFLIGMTSGYIGTLIYDKVSTGKVDISHAEANAIRGGFNGGLTGVAFSVNPRGAILGLTAQGAADIFVSGEFSSLETYTGAALGTSIVDFFVGPQGVIIASSVSTLTTDLLENLLGIDQHSIPGIGLDLLENSLIAYTVDSFLGGKILSNFGSSPNIGVRTFSTITDIILSSIGGGMYGALKTIANLKF